MSLSRSTWVYAAGVVVSASVATAAFAAPPSAPAPIPVKPAAAPSVPPEYVRIPTVPPASPQTLASELARVTKASRPVDADLGAAVELSVASPVRAGVAGLDLRRASVWVDVATGTADAELDGTPAGTAPPPLFGSGDDRAVRAARVHFFATVGNAVIQLTARAGVAYVVDCDVSDGPFVIDVGARQQITATAAGNRLVFAFAAPESGPTRVALSSGQPGRWALRRCRVAPELRR